MRRTKLAALMMTLLLLSACGKTEQAGFEELRTSVAGATGAEVTAKVTADLGDKVREYTIRFTGDAEGCVMEVLEPSLIAGVRARITGAAHTLEYDGLVLDTGEFTEDGPTAITALPLLMQAIAQGHVDNTWTDKGTMGATLVPDDELRVALTLDSDTKAPSYAEIIDGETGRTLVKCEIQEFALT